MIRRESRHRSSFDGMQGVRQSCEWIGCRTHVIHHLQALIPKGISKYPSPMSLPSRPIPVHRPTCEIFETSDTILPSWPACFHARALRHNEAIYLQQVTLLPAWPRSVIMDRRKDSHGSVLLRVFLHQCGSARSVHLIVVVKVKICFGDRLTVHASECNQKFQ